MRFVFKMYFRAFQLSKPFDVDSLVCVDQNIIDGRIFEQWLDRTKTDHFIDDFSRKYVEFFLIERDAFRTNIVYNI